jgi:hypothetical protein
MGAIRVVGGGAGLAAYSETGDRRWACYSRTICTKNLGRGRSAIFRGAGPTSARCRVGQAVGDGHDGAFHAAWVRAGDRLAAEAEVALAKGHRVSDREVWRATSAMARPVLGIEPQSAV